MSSMQLLGLVHHKNGCRLAYLALASSGSTNETYIFQKLVSNPQAYDRYSYTFNNPVKYVDPSGHKPCWATAQYTCDKRDVTDWLAKALTDTASSMKLTL